MPGTDLVPYAGPERRQAVREHRFELKRRDAWARGLAPLWFLTLLAGLYGVTEAADRRVPYAVTAVALGGTLGSTWLLSHTAFRWQFRRAYRWWHPRDHWWAHRAYQNFKAHYPVVVAWRDLATWSRVPDAIGGSRREDRPEPEAGRTRRSRPTASHGWPGDA